MQLTQENLYYLSSIIYYIQTVCITIMRKSLYILYEIATLVSGMFVNVTQHLAMMSSDDRYRDVD